MESGIPSGRERRGRERDKKRRAKAYKESKRIKKKSYAETHIDILGELVVGRLVFREHVVVHARTGQSRAEKEAEETAWSVRYSGMQMI